MRRARRPIEARRGPGATQDPPTRPAPRVPGEEQRRAIGRLCLSNILRLVAANDAGVRSLSLPPGFRNSDMHALTHALHDNTTLRAIRFEHAAITDIGATSLIEQFPSCVEYVSDGRVPYPPPFPDAWSGRLSAANQLKIKRKCDENKSRHEGEIASIVQHRAFQRLLLAAFYEASSVSLSRDLLETIVGHLDQSSACPFKTAGFVSLPSHDAIFAWHVPDNRGGAQDSDIIPPVESEKGKKRQRRD